MTLQEGKMGVLLDGHVVREFLYLGCYLFNFFFCILMCFFKKTKNKTKQKTKNFPKVLPCKINLFCNVLFISFNKSEVRMTKG